MLNTSFAMRALRAYRVVPVAVDRENQWLVMSGRA